MVKRFTVEKFELIVIGMIIGFVGTSLLIGPHWTTLSAV
jgi:hypothetical protein